MIKKLIIIFITLIIVSGCNINTNNNYRLNIVTSNYISYDFARNITKDVEGVNVSMLMLPGSEIHDYEPTPKDIVNIKSSDIFIYIGGESDSWVDTILESIDSKTKIIKLMDYVDLKEEELKEGMEATEEENEEIEYDEHIWTSPVNAKILVETIENEIVKIDKEHEKEYTKNSKEYINEINNIHEEIKKIVSSSIRKELIFADRFPFLYFTKLYNLEYYAAFLGCAHETEASAKTISFLINKVKEDNIPVILTIELSNQNIAKTISEETGSKILSLNSAHNITKEEFENGVTYVDIMKKNIEVLKEALN